MAMDDEDFRGIMEGLDEVRRFVAGEDVPGVRVHIPAEWDPRPIRAQLGLTQEEFARRFQIPVASLRDWEQGRRQPDRAAQAYLKVIKVDAAVVERALEIA